MDIVLQSELKINSVNRDYAHGNIMAIAEAADADAAYKAWKNWTNESFGSLTKIQSAYYDAELRQVGRDFSSGANVLELGFGNGAFLSYGRAHGWNVYGTELNPQLVQSAQIHGYDAKNAAPLDTLWKKQFDLVVAFDVLEHIPRNDLVDFVASIRKVMVPGGIFIARFPNGDSPLGLANQNGDITHVSAIGSGVVQYLAATLDMKLIYVGRTARPIFGVGPSLMVKRLILNTASFLTEVTLGKLLCPSPQATLMSVDLLMVLAAN